MMLVSKNIKQLECVSSPSTPDQPGVFYVR